MNFDYLKAFPDMKKLYGYCAEAEEFTYSKPNISASSARKAMEFVVKMMYASIVGETAGLTLFDMLSDYRFTDYIGKQEFINSLHYIRKMGNIAVHDGDITKEEALTVLSELHFIVSEFCILIGLLKEYPHFQAPSSTSATAATPTAATPTAPAPASEKEIEKKLEAPSKQVEVAPELIAKYGPHMRQVRFDMHAERDEEENKKLYMAACLREAGWPIVSQPDQAMPESAGINMLLDDGDSVDYVLYGKDNKPLALIEYTTTTKNLVEGRMKAVEKANKLAVKYGYKPIAYYTNGYLIYIIDQLGYKPRRVFQFHSLEELERLKVRANIRQDIKNPVIDDAITNRPYQKEAIRAACHAFDQKRRHSLLVMATGTGKTRVAISLADILMKANWAKTILFLADRTSLVRQAHKNFNKLLPSVTTSIYAGGSMQKDPNARIIFATYQTMIRLINDDTKEFSIGRFDLIIIDEAHRSVFKKYGAIFRYFDALMLGLTATPRNENNKSTYQVFQMENGHPDYAYELEQAIQDGYLVGFSVLDKTTAALRRGIRYDDLSEEDKEKIEDAFIGDEDKDSGVDFSNKVIEEDEMYAKGIINIGTIDVMLNDLMKNSLRIKGGDRIGKTIIFARSHVEAETIVGRFQTLYAYLGADFCKLIDSQVVNGQNLIDNFGERDQLPQVVVSVDMLDTGIDVPDVLNLVFFKPVASKIKFLQMIGRGTRLSPDVYGPGMDKQGFLIFDYYDNFGYFQTQDTWLTVTEADGKRAYAGTPQSELLNQTKLKILRSLVEKEALTPFEQSYCAELNDHFISTIRGLCNDEVDVQYSMSYVSKYRTAEEWDHFTDEKVNDIETRILPLFPSEPDPVKVKTFDLLIYRLEEEIPKRLAEGKDIRKIRHGFANVDSKIDDMMHELLKLKTIPAIVKKEELITKMQHADLLFDHFSLELCEDVRKELRDLMAYIPDKREYYIINVEDYVIDPGVGGGLGYEKSYAERVKEYLEKGSPALAKLRNLDELTQEEKTELEDTFKNKLGTQAEYAAWLGDKALLPLLRVQVGIADEAIATKFGAFLNEETLNENQLTYMRQIISYARENGDITFMDLQKVSPFCDVDVINLFQDRVSYIKTLINGLHKPVIMEG